MNLIKKMAKDGWHVKIWPHYRGYTVVFNKAGEDERIGRGDTIKLAARRAVRGL